MISRAIAIIASTKALILRNFCPNLIFELNLIVETISQLCKTKIGAINLARVNVKPNETLDLWKKNKPTIPIAAIGIGSPRKSILSCSAAVILYLASLYAEARI